MKPVIVIPAYKPDHRLADLVKEFLADPAQNIVVINDGSGPEYQPLFENIKKMSDRVQVLEHAVNLGKGNALKTAFNHVLLNFPADCPGVVTADADGQHDPSDVKRFVTHLIDSPDVLWLGIRSFDRSVPLRSRFGNNVTRLLFLIFFHHPLRDTQTGLRAIPRTTLQRLLRINRPGYEFEFEMLVEAIQNNLPIREDVIKTIYLDNNKKSHFDPLFDSLRIYFVFLRFSALSFASWLLDTVLFVAVYSISHRIFVSTLVARLFSGSFQFLLGKKFVFKSRGRAIVEITKYALLVTTFMMISYGLVTTLVVFVGLSILAAKVVSEGCLFISSFAIQRMFVFMDSFGSEEPLPPTPNKTDWDAYYSAPAKPATITRKITEKLLLDLMRKYSPEKGIDQICELGGANSCFYSAIRRTYPKVHYSIVDNNRKGLDLFLKAHAKENVSVKEADVLTNGNGATKADVVFSVGLIEHFSPVGTAQVIRSHFQYSTPGQIVIITFPTPTLLYRITRGFIEKLGLWIFHDERPLNFDEVLSGIEPYAEILHTSINWKIILTQGVIVARTRQP